MFIVSLTYNIICVYIYSVDAIDRMVPYAVVQKPEVPDNQKLSVQVVALDDVETIHEI